ncbi:MAG: hypothetical protein HXY34_00270 [Candidatus Thorarchaeota archaeon]|nr:hypothetical protein [Candidatus Thorarchaeota archaeon]
MGGYGSDYSYSTSDAVVKKTARQYNVDQGREYSQTTAVMPPPRGRVLVTKAKLPVVVSIDVTGSMRELPALIFEKLCILYNEAVYFLPDELKNSFEISFVAMGDAYSDKHPLQVTDFDKGRNLDQNIRSLYAEGGGGGQYRESYELVAYFYSACCEMPNAMKTVRPLFFFIGDEGYYSKVNRFLIRELIGNEPTTDLIALDVFEELKKRFDVYMLRVPYKAMGEVDKEIHASWEEALGKDRVIVMQTPRRVVDIILGLIAASVERFDAYKERIEVRQTPEQVDQVFSSLDGLRLRERAYVYKLQALKCPSCGASIQEMPSPDHPVKCQYCQVLLVRM